MTPMISWFTLGLVVNQAGHGSRLALVEEWPFALLWESCQDVRHLGLITTITLGEFK